MEEQIKKDTKDTHEQTLPPLIKTGYSTPRFLYNTDSTVPGYISKIQTKTRPFSRRCKTKPTQHLNHKEETGKPKKKLSIWSLQVLEHLKKLEIRRMEEERMRMEATSASTKKS